VSFTDILIIFGIVLVTLVGILAALAITAWIMWKRATREERTLIKRFSGLEFGSKFQLAGRLVADGRIPIVARVALPVLVLYLALPIDIIPDFIPVIGWLDDIFLLVIGLNIVLRMTPRYVLEENIQLIETAELDRKAIEAERGGPEPTSGNSEQPRLLK
jgi:uncharacterized membrane protein YkvA (DUF1232 family)